ncbi:MAG: iron-containing redox enzyme family protein [Deltaproteobacteria bacterium]
MAGAGTGVDFARERGQATRAQDARAPMAVLRGIRAATMAELAGCRIVADALAGRSRSEDYISYLTSVFHYARFSPVIMAAAASRCSQSHPELSAYLLKHAAEEQGHDVWALEDLAKLGVPADQIRRARPAPACAALVGYVHNLATIGNPIAIFGWMYILEAVGSDIGVAAGEKLDAAHGGADAPIHFVAGHGEADADHTVEIEAQIEAHLEHDTDRADVCETARVVSWLYTTMFRQVGNETAQWQSP